MMTGNYVNRKLPLLMIFFTDKIKEIFGFCFFFWFCFCYSVCLDGRTAK